MGGAVAHGRVCGLWVCAVLGGYIIALQIGRGCVCDNNEKEVVRWPAENVKFLCSVLFCNLKDAFLTNNEKGWTGGQLEMLNFYSFLQNKSYP